MQSRSGQMKYTTNFKLTVKKYLKNNGHNIF